MYRIPAVFGVMFGLALLVASCGEDGKEDGKGEQNQAAANCMKGCATTSTLKCKNEDQASCVKECQALQAQTTCMKETSALLGCAAARPASDFQCNSDGESQLNDGVCDAEFQAAFLCALTGS